MKKLPYSSGVLLAWDIAVVETTRAQLASIGPEQFLCGLFKIKEALSYASSKQHFAADKLKLLRYEADALDSILDELKIDRIKARQRLRQIVGKGNRTWKKDESVPRSDISRLIFERAGEICRSHNAQAIDAIHLFEAIMDSPTPHLQTLFKELAVDINSMEQLAKEINGKTGHVQQTQNKEPDINETPAKNDYADFFQENNLSELGRDLTELARNGRIDPVIGRRDELLQVVRTLTRKTKANPVLVGEAGVGKTAIVEGLAQRIAEKNISKYLWDKRIVELRMSSLIAGTQYRGDLEKRLKQIMETAEQDENLILFLDELHLLVGSGENMSIGNILKPALARGTMRCIGATTFDEYQKHIESDPALARRFIRIRVEEPDEKDTLMILRGLLPGMEKHHAVNIEDNALEAAVKLSVRYMKDRRLPDKAIDVIDEACAIVKVETLSYIPKNDTSVLQEDGTFIAIEPVTSHIVAQVISEKTGIGMSDLIDSESDKFVNLEKQLKKRVIGQNDAIEKVTSRLQLSAAGLRDEGKPMGVFMFLGPTGVGKTFLAECITELIFGHTDSMIRIDMSEFMEKHSIARLVGSPPGYIGHDEEGQLTGALKKHPYSLVLLDEVEKANPQVWDLFLQVFDDGRLTDGKGKTIDASHAIFVMTSNIGSSAKVHRPIGFIENTETNAAHTDHYSTALRENFRPEFINRIDETVIFNSLDKQSINAITRREIDNLILWLYERDIELNIDDQAVTLLSKLCFSPEFGARHARRTIETAIGKPVSEYLLQDKLNEGDQLTISCEDEKIIFKINTAGKN